MSCLNAVLGTLSGLRLLRSCICTVKYISSFYWDERNLYSGGRLRLGLVGELEFQRMEAVWSSKALVPAYQNINWQYHKNVKSCMNVKEKIVSL